MSIALEPLSHKVQRTAVVAGDIGAAGIGGCAGISICGKALPVAEAGSSAVSVVQLDATRWACRQRCGGEQREQHHNTEQDA